MWLDSIGLKRPFVLLVLLFCIGLTGCNGAAPTMAEQYPEAYALFTEMYGEYFALDEEGAFTLSVNENGILTLPGSDGAQQRPLLPSELEFVEYKGTDLTVEIDRIEDDVLYYSYMNNTSDTIKIYSRRMYLPYASWEPLGYNTYIEVLADGLWWTVDVNYAYYPVTIHRTLNRGKSDFYEHFKVWVYDEGQTSKSEFDYRTIPTGTYRLVQWIQPFANAAIVTEFQVEQRKSETVVTTKTGEPPQEEDDAVSPNMAEQYPEAYALFSEMYGEYFALDEEGAFTLSVNENGILTLPGTEGVQQRPLLPSELEFVEYKGTDLTVEIDRIEDDVLYYSYINHISEDILLYNGHTYMPYSTTEYNNYVEVMADGLWWAVDVNYSAKRGAVYNDVSPGENQLRQDLCVWVYEPDMAGNFAEFESIPFPAGTYRMVQWIQPFANAAMVTEFSIEDVS